MISEFDGKNTLYIGYVGNFNEEQIFKFGISERIFQRTIVEHTKTFGTFQLLYLRESDNNKQIEDLFCKELICKNIYRKISRGIC